MELFLLKITGLRRLLSGFTGLPRNIALGFYSTLNTQFSWLKNLNCDFNDYMMDYDEETWCIALRDKESTPFGTLRLKIQNPKVHCTLLYNRSHPVRSGQKVERQVIAPCKHFIQILRRNFLTY